MNPATEFDAEPNRLLPSRIFSIYGSKKRELIALQCRWSACNLMTPFKVASRCQVTENDIIGHLRISDPTSDTARRRRRVASSAVKLVLNLKNSTNSKVLSTHLMTKQRSWQCCNWAEHADGIRNCSDIDSSTCRAGSEFSPVRLTPWIGIFFWKKKGPKMPIRTQHTSALNDCGLFIIRLVEGATRFLVGADKDGGFRNCLSARWKKLLLHEKMPLLAPNSQRPTSLYTNIFFLLHLVHIVSPRPGDVTFLKRSAFFYIPNSSFF